MLAAGQLASVLYLRGRTDYRDRCAQHNIFSMAEVADYFRHT
jgi:hypothetical protein